MKPSTIAIHVGNEPEKETGAVIAPIYQTSTFARGEGEHVYEYTRAGNPNFTYLEETISALEDAKFATVFSSGLGAITALVSLLKFGDHIVASEDLYGGTARLLNQVFERFGIRTQYVSASEAGSWEVAITPKTKLFIIESPTNPLLKIADISKISQIAANHGIIAAVDNTFATPIFQRPLALGAVVSLHSTTKYIGGHSDVIGGAIATNDEKLKERFNFARKAMGLNPSPFDCWLVARGLKTLALRMERHEENAMELANFLRLHPGVKDVIYPGLDSHPGHKLAKKQMLGFGGMISIRVKGTKGETEAAFSRLKIFTRAESLGGVESLISHPATQTHASLSLEERKRRGIGDDLWRLSVGIEDKSDLKEDLENSLNFLSKRGVHRYSPRKTK